MSTYNAEITIVGGGGGGGVNCGGGGGGGQICRHLCSFNSNSLYICVGKGGLGGGSGSNSKTRGLDGEYTCILYKDGTPFDYAKGGGGADVYMGGQNGNGNPIPGGVDCISYCAGGGGAGASGRGGNGDSSCYGGNGGEGLYGYGGGGGAYGCWCCGCGVDGGGNGDDGCGCNGVNGGGGGGADYRCGGNGGDGLVIIKYANDGSYGINEATGGTKEVGEFFTTHTFTSDGTFTIVS